MSITYNITTNFGAKDTLPSNDPDKVIQGAEFTVEYEAIKTAFVSAITASGTSTFTNKSGNISQWTNDSGYSTSDTTYTAGVGLLLTGTEFTNTIINNNQLTNGSSYITAISADALTNKTGAISQWTNDSGYTTATGTVTPSSTDTFTNKSGAISQWTNDSSYVTTSTLASETVVGIIELATQAEVNTGTDAVRAVTPATLATSPYYINPVMTAVKTTTYTAVANDLIPIDTSGGAWTLTLPASPSVDDRVYFFDYGQTFNTNNLTIARNGEEIMNLAEDLTADVQFYSGSLLYVNATQGWILA